jgi:hypothetical protein
MHDNFLAQVRDTLTARGNTYGNTLEHTAVRWSQTLGVKVTPAQVCLCMIDLKMARLAHKIHPDGAIDLAGYAALLSDC